MEYIHIMKKTKLHFIINGLTIKTEILINIYFEIKMNHLLYFLVFIHLISLNYYFNLIMVKSCCL